MRKPLTRKQALDPKQCMKCHPNHYKEWTSSMHAYASTDPVFLAMNKRGQRETNGELGDFCLKCHAPMAVLDKKLSDPSKVEELPDEYKGVTCYLCHNADSVQGEHNAAIHLTNDDVMRGSIHNPRQPGVHRAEYSKLLDGNEPQSSTMCGGCHDIVTPVPANVHLERTFEEYKASVFATGRGFDTCAGCHMVGYPGVAADDPPSRVPSRNIHEHLWAGVDVALTDFPYRDVQNAAVQCALLNGTTIFSIESNFMGSPGQFNVVLETEAGHRQPSGAAQDRRMWLELTAYDANGDVSFQTGSIADDEVEEKPTDDPKRDPHLWMFRDRIFDKDGNPTHMFWQAAPSTQFPKGYKEPADTLPVRIDIATPHFVSKTFQLPLISQDPHGTARVVAHVRMRPMGLDVLQDLVDSGDLDPAVMAQMPTFTLYGTETEWKIEDGITHTVLGPKPPPDSLQCPNAYRCLLRPDDERCSAKP
jgi:hypothetical protein